MAAQLRLGAEITRMIYLTQLIYVREGREADFQQFEEILLPRLSQYSGVLVLRLWPDRASTKSLAPAICHMKCTSSASKPRKLTLCSLLQR